MLVQRSDNGRSSLHPRRTTDSQRVNVRLPIKAGSCTQTLVLSTAVSRNVCNKINISKLNSYSVFFILYSSISFDYHGCWKCFCSIFLSPYKHIASYSDVSNMQMASRRMADVQSTMRWRCAETTSPVFPWRQAGIASSLPTASPAATGQAASM